MGQVWGRRHQDRRCPLGTWATPQLKAASTESVNRTLPYPLTVVEAGYHSPDLMAKGEIIAQGSWHSATRRPFWFRDGLAKSFLPVECCLTDLRGFFQCQRLVPLGIDLSHVRTRVAEHHLSGLQPFFLPHRRRERVPQLIRVPVRDAGLRRCDTDGVRVGVRGVLAGKNQLPA